MATAAELIEMKLPPREFVVSPILGRKGIMMVHAVRGTGKTFFVLSLAYAIAAGVNFLKWKVPEARRVLVIDGEMALEDLKSRLIGIEAGFGTKLENAERLKFIAADYHENGLPDLSTQEGQDALWPNIMAADVIIFDNLSTLFTTLRENENDDAQIANAFFLEIRRRGKAVIIVHHSGKSGQQRGGSRREDALNTVVSLRQPDDYDQKDGCLFNVVFEKARGFFGEDAETFRAELCSADNGTMKWKIVDIIDHIAEQASELVKQGLTQSEISKELGTSLGSVNRALQRKKAAGKNEKLAAKENDGAHGIIPPSVPPFQLFEGGTMEQ